MGPVRPSFGSYLTTVTPRVDSVSQILSAREQKWPGGTECWQLAFLASLFVSTLF